MSSTAISCSIHGVPLGYRTIAGTTMTQPFCPVCESLSQAPASSAMTTVCGPDYYAFWLETNAELLDAKAESDRLDADLRALRSAVWRIVSDVDADHIATTEGGDRTMLTDVEAEAVRVALIEGSGNP